MINLPICRVCSTTTRAFVRRALSKATPKLQPNSNVCLISCKRKEFNHYQGQEYGNLDDIRLVSKGWSHNKSMGDFFVIHPNPDVYKLDFGNEFATFPMHANIIDYTREQNLVDATQLQEEAFHVISEGKHVLIAAETGCGKTLAYALPVVNALANDAHKEENFNTPRALIVAPNRELAKQIGEIVTEIGNRVGLTTHIAIGGAMKKQIFNPHFAHVDILVGTPGAIGKLSNVGIFKLHSVKCVVLDEADTLLDMSFEDRVPNIVRKVAQAQCVLVSATLPTQFPDYLQPIVDRLVHITSPLLHKPLSNVTQRFLRLSRSAKPAQLLQIAKANQSPMLVFSNRNKTCDWIAMFLNENGITASNLAGDTNRLIRIENWNRFVSGEVKILSSTDVGSRGLDTTAVAHVVNYDFPLYAADYLHRIGRTGRFGSPRECKITNFISGPEEVRLVQEVEVIRNGNRQQFSRVK